ncbi:MAG: hypothetical protein J6M95_03180 [Bacilli bacterium]|nr:hypothetical protein [Bacilli bacterium]
MAEKDEKKKIANKPVKANTPIKEKKVKVKAKKEKEVQGEEHRAFETRPDIKKIVLYTVIVPRGQGENIIRIFKANKSSAQFLQYGEGTASNAIRDILGVEDTKKDIVYSFVREETVPDIKKEIDAYFVASKRNKGIAYTIQLSSIVGVKMYKFLTQTVRG